MASTVLIIDDNKAVTEIIRALLLRNGYRVEVVNSAACVPDLLAERPVDVIVSDVMMPGLDGFRLGRMIRDDPATADIPIVFLTALDTLEDEFEAYLSGADAFMTKPFKARELLGTLKRVIERRASPASSGRLAAVQIVARVLATVGPGQKRLVESAAGQAGFELEFADDLADALQSVDRDRYHALICDLSHEADAVKLVRQFMEHFALALPVVFLHTADNAPALNATADRYTALRVPSPPDILAEELRRLVHDFDGLP